MVDMTEAMKRKLRDLSEGLYAHNQDSLNNGTFCALQRRGYVAWEPGGDRAWIGNWRITEAGRQAAFLYPPEA